jgi:alkylhydroperoxidase family enzyme
MPLVEPLPDAQATEPAQKLFQGIQSKLGTVLNIFRTMGHAPDVLQVTLQFDQAIKHGLDPKLRELAYLRTSEINHCDY